MTNLSMIISYSRMPNAREKNAAHLHTRKRQTRRDPGSKTTRLNAAQTIMTAQYIRQAMDRKLKCSEGADFREHNRRNAVQAE
jgi:hypothetical protein